MSTSTPGRRSGWKRWATSSSLLLAAIASLGAAPLSADDAVRAALEKDPTLAAAEARQTSADGAWRASTFLRTNPDVDVLIGEDTVEIEGVQPLSLTGEGIAAAHAARATRDAADAAVDRARLETAARAREAWVHAVVAHQQAVFAGEILDLSTQLRQAAEERLGTGAISELDLRLARLDEAKAAGEYLAAVDEEAVAFGALAALIGEPADAIDVGDDPLLGVPAAKGGAERSDVRAAIAEQDAAKAAVAREKAARMPLVGVGAFYHDDGGVTALGPKVSVEVPLWKRNPGGVGAARADLDVASAQVASTIAAAEADRATTALRTAAADKVLAASPADVHADATAALAQIEEALKSGDLDLPDALALIRQVVDGERGAVEARGRAADAKIEALLAVDDTGLIPTLPPR